MRWLAITRTRAADSAAWPEFYLVRGVGLIKDLDDIRAIVLKESGGTPVYIRDVAEVRVRRRSPVRRDDQGRLHRSVGGIVMMVAGGNAKEIVSEIKDRVEEINCERHAAGRSCGSCRTTTGRNWWMLRSHTVSKVLVEGIVLVVVVLFLFLGDLRSSVIVIATLMLTPAADVPRDEPCTDCRRT